MSNGFSTILVAVLAAVLVVTAVAVVKVSVWQKVEPVAQVSESGDLGVIEEEIDETSVEFPEDELKEMESEAASL